MLDLKKLLFAHETLRDHQNELILEINKAINQGTNLVAHAPTGLGKTAAAIGPALAYAIENDKTVFFLTSRHTQHKIAIDTLKQIKKTFEINFDVVDLVGKKWMCPVTGVDKLYSSEFSEYCKNARENNSCEFYINTKDKSKMSVIASNAIKNIKILMPIDAEKLYEMTVEDKLCPYEISMSLAAKAKIIIADYYYIFHDKIRDTLLSKSSKELEDCIVIVDEAHNLPNRIKDLATQRLTNNILRRAITEAKKYQLTDITEYVVQIHDIFLNYSKGLKAGDEKTISKHDFLNKIKNIADYDNLLSQLELAAINIRESQKQSYLGSISAFLESWRGDDLGFTRIFSFAESRHEELLTLSYRCLDPSIITSDIINQTHSTILMSGTLTPTEMYVETLGIKNVFQNIYDSPFPEENRLNLIVPGVSTKFTMRNEKEYQNMAEICAKIVDNVPGNCSIFFPSYYMMSSVSKYFDTKTSKTVIKELSGMTKSEKAEIFDKFKEYKHTGAVLLGAITGSFGEGVDLPGDLLKCVIIVGLPLSKPDLETKSLIDYYDKKFSKGWDYGYTAPAFNKTLQGAGRCIRTETDKGVIVFLDDRYAWNNYFKYFPKDWKMKITRNPDVDVKHFFTTN